MKTGIRARAAGSALAVVALVSGCMGDAAPTPTPVGGVAGPTVATTPLDYGVPKNPAIAALGPVELHVLFAADYYKTAPVVAVVQAFQTMYPNVKITLDGTEWSQIPARVKTSIAEGTASVDLAHQHAFVMGAQGYAESIDDLWSQVDEAGLMPGSIEDTVWNGTHYGVPLDINCLFTIYRKDLFEKAGLKPPGPDWTYTQAHDDLKKLTSGSQYGIALTRSSWDTSGLVRANGGALLSTDGKTATLDNAANIATLQYLSDLINVDHVSPPPPAPGDRYDAVTDFWSGKVAVLWTGPWDLGRIRNEAPPSFKDICPNLACLGTTTLPHGMNGSTTGSVQGGGSLFIPKGSKHKSVAFELMRWYLSPAYQLAMVKDQARFPVLQALYSRPELTGDPLAQPFFEQLKTAHPYRLEAIQPADNAWADAVNAILAGAPAAETLRAAQAKAQAALDSTK
jgi:ABC-type glycerol-3-phosphate transport system substrate-binding protein